jgi:hypothetical protein
MQRIVITLLLPLLLIFSCEPCGKGYNPKTQITGLRIMASDSNRAMLGQDSVLIQGDTAFFNLQFNVVRVAATLRSFNIISTATACKNLEPYLINNIDSLAVIAVDTWDAVHPPMSAISDYVTAKKYWGNLGQVDTTFQQYALSITKINRNYFQSTTWFGIHKLPTKRKGRFYVWLRLSDGVELKSNVLKVVE